VPCGERGQVEAVFMPARPKKSDWACFSLLQLVPNPHGTPRGMFPFLCFADSGGDGMAVWKKGPCWGLLNFCS